MRRVFASLLLPIAFALAVAPTLCNEPVAAAENKTGETAKTGDNGGHGSGEAPMDFKTDLALWSLIVFLIFLFVLKKFAWGPLTAGLDARESRIRQDIAKAEDARIKAEKMLAEHQTKLDAVQDEIREIIAEARRDADHTRQEIIETAQKEAEVTRNRAIGEIGRARDQALKELFDVMSAQVSQATEHVVGRSLTDKDHDRFVQEALAQFSQGS